MSCDAVSGWIRMDNDVIPHKRLFTFAPRLIQSGLDTLGSVAVWASDGGLSHFAPNGLNVCLDALEQG